jgi:hypothetical protein
MGTGYTDHFNTQLITTRNYTRSVIADLHTLQITVTHAKVFSSVFASSCLVTVSNNGQFYASGLRSSLNGGSLPTELFLREREREKKKVGGR